MGSLVTWEWERDKNRCSRDAATLNVQGAPQVTQYELRHVQEVDGSFTRQQVLDRIANRVVEGLADTQAGSSRPPVRNRCLAGFSNFNHTAKWERLLDIWLPTFDFNLLLSRKVDSEAATGDAKQPFTQCFRAVANLTDQYADRDSGGLFTHEEMHGQLTMLALCLPILLLRYNKLDRPEERRAKIIK